MAVDWKKENPEGGTNEDVVKTLWARGHSASQIARYIPGATRSSVLGKAYRLKLDGRKGVTKSNGQSRKVRRAAAQKGRGTATKRKKVPPPAPSKPIRKFNLDAPPSDSRSVPLMELTDDTCKFPDGTFEEKAQTFCGCRVKLGFPYCEFHCGVAYHAR